jgi:hypothetical protein
VTLGPVNTINTVAPGRSLLRWGWVLSGALTQRPVSRMCSLFLASLRLRRVERPVQAWRRLWGYVLLTCRRRAWPSTYFPGGLVWAGIGPDAARTAAGRFATRQEKSVDSTQFRPSTLPCRMFPSLPALSFYSLSSGFSVCVIRRGMVPMTETGTLGGDSFPVYHVALGV